MTAPARSASRVVVQAAMSLDGFIAGPGDAMDWVFEYAAPEEFPELAQAAGAMLSAGVATTSASETPGSRAAKPTAVPGTARCSCSPMSRRPDRRRT